MPSIVDITPEHDPLYRYRFLLRVPLTTLQYRQIVGTIVREILAYADLTIDLDRQLEFLTSYNPIVYWAKENEFVSNRILPYVVITEAQIQDQYQPMFLGQLAGTGFRTQIYRSDEYKAVIVAENVYNDIPETYETVQIRDLQVFVYTSRLPLRITGYMYFETYDQLIDVYNSFVRFFVVNRINYIEIPVLIVVPKQVALLLPEQDRQAIIQFQKENILVSENRLIDDKSAWYIVMRIPTYYRLESVTDQSQLAVTGGEGQRFRLSFTLYVDTGHVGLYEFSVLLPIKGCVFKFDAASIFKLYTSELETDGTASFTIVTDRDYQKDTLVIELPSQIDLTKQQIVGVYLYRSTYTPDNAIAISKELAYALDIENKRITINEFVPGNAVVKVIYTTT